MQKKLWGPNLFFLIALIPSFALAAELNEKKIEKSIMSSLRQAGVNARYISYSTDPGVNREYTRGSGPCPKNEDPSADEWHRWKGPVSKQEKALARAIMKNSSVPMGSLVTVALKGKIIGARVEWHTIKGKTGERGCFRGVILLQKVR